jgi:hypothetical protein
VEQGVAHDRQLEVSREVFARVREMYEELESGQASRHLNED